MTTLSTPKLDESRLWTTKDAAFYCAVTPRTIHDWRQKGWLDFFVLESGSIRYCPQDVKAAARRRCVGRNRHSCPETNG